MHTRLLIMTLTMTVALAAACIPALAVRIVPTHDDVIDVLPAIKGNRADEKRRCPTPCSGVLSELNLPMGAFVWALLQFNVGLVIGQ